MAGAHLRGTGTRLEGPCLFISHPTARLDTVRFSTDKFPENLLKSQVHTRLVRGSAGYSLWREKCEFVEWRAWIMALGEFGGSGLKTARNLLLISLYLLTSMHNHHTHRHQSNHPYSCLINRSHPYRSRHSRSTFAL